MIDIRKERDIQRVAQLKKELEDLYYNQPNGTYQFMEWQHSVWEINRKIKLLENSIKKHQIN